MRPRPPRTLFAWTGSAGVRRCRTRRGYSETDPEARIARMKDGTTHLAYKPEHAIDLDTGAVVAAEVHAADEGDTTTITGTGGMRAGAVGLRTSGSRCDLRSRAALLPCRPRSVGRGAALPRRPAQRGMLASGRRRAARAIVTRIRRPAPGSGRGFSPE